MKLSTRAFGHRAPRRVVAPLAACVGLLLALGANEASAAALGSLTTSVGLFAALTALFVIKGLPANLPASALSTAGGALVIVGGAAWWWRARVAGRVTGLLWFERAPFGPAPSCSSLGRCDDVALPAGVDRTALLLDLRQHFVQLQEAWDLGAMPALRLMTTPDMLEELRLGLPACATGEARSRSDVVTLHADLFAFEELAGDFLVSVEFSGLMRDAPGEGAAPFRELWMLTRSKDRDSGWKLARHQALL